MMMLKQCGRVVLLAGLFIMITGGVETVLAEKVPLEELYLNRSATKLTDKELQDKGFPYAQTGFMWEGFFLDKKGEIISDDKGPKKHDDNATTLWRPQGIVGLGEFGEGKEKKKFLAVSWYGRDEFKITEDSSKKLEGEIPAKILQDLMKKKEYEPEKDFLKEVKNQIKHKPTFEYYRTRILEEADSYSKRGVRISFVDVTKMGSIKYRHVLLVKKDGVPFAGMHAGGLFYRNGDLHVPDSKASSKDSNGRYPVHVFSISSIKKVEKEDEVYGYPYILQEKQGKEESPYWVTITPSFMSYDWTKDKERLLVGTFKQCDKDKDYHLDTPECRSLSENQLAWYNLTKNRDGSYFAEKQDSQSCKPFFSEMQGAASENGVLWVVSSYGSIHNSHLHIVSSSCKKGENNDYREITYPPGLESAYINSPSAENAYIWMLTEFGSDYGIGNDRIVFATDKKDLMPIQKDK